MYTEKEVKELLKEQQKLTIQQFSNYDFNNLQLSVVEIMPKNRRNGKTTRCVDKAIQYLFKHKTLNLYRGFDNESEQNSDFLDPDFKSHYKAQFNFIDKVLKRLYSEHDGQYKLTRELDNYRITVE